MQYPSLRYVPEHEDPSLTLETRDLCAKVIDNTGLLAPPVPPEAKAYFNPTFRFTPFTHHLGYHGVRTLYDKRERRNIVAGFVSWLNLQMVRIDGREADVRDERSAYGLGRGWPMRMERAGAGALLTIDPLPSLRMKYTLELQPAEPDGIDFKVRFEVLPRAESGGPGSPAPTTARLAGSWPCYMNAFDDVRLFYPRGSPEKWAWASIGEPPGIVIGETVGYTHEQTCFNVVEQAFPLAFGRIGSRALAIMFRDPRNSDPRNSDPRPGRRNSANVLGSASRIEFFTVNAGGHSYLSPVQNPAWDWWWGIDDAPFNTPVGYDGRLIYTPFVSEADLFARYEAFRAGD